MGTYTANYQLYMPTVGEQGWGDLMNGNLTTIDTTMAGLNTRIGTLETETDAFDTRITALESIVDVETGTIYADEICGFRVGQFSTTQPNPWTSAMGDESFSWQKMSFIYSDSNTQSGTATAGEVTYELLSGWDKIDNLDQTCEYTLSVLQAYSTSLFAKTVNLSITSALTGNVFTYTFSNTSVSSTHVFEAPAIISSVTFTLSNRSTTVSTGGGYGGAKITRSPIYIVPKTR